MPDEYKANIVRFKEELDKQINETIRFMDTHGFTLIQKAEKDRLEEQLLLMEDLSKILGERISFF